MSEFTMPSLGADMDRGTVVEWKVAPGDRVGRGDIVALVETEKGIIEVEIWDEGTITELLVTEGSEVPVGTPLATVESDKAAPETLPGATAGDSVAPEAIVSPPPNHEPVAHPPTPPIRHLAHELGVDLERVTGSGPGGSITRADVQAAAPRTNSASVIAQSRAIAESRPKASPRARQAAEDLIVDLRLISGTGVDGMITEADVRSARPGLAPARQAEDTSPASPPLLAPTRVQPAATDSESDSDKAEERRLAMRRAIAQVMAKSKREIPHYYLGTTVDMTTALTWLTDHNEGLPMAERILPVVLLLKASALATRDVPEINGFFVDGQFRPGEGVHLGVAISLRTGGLIAPALHDTDRKDLPRIMSDLTDLVARTRTGRLRSSEMSDPTLTITNLGDRGVEEGYGVIYAPQVALVCFGKVSERPWAEDGMLGARRVVRVGLSADHRVSDGHRGGLYLEAIDHYLQEPETL